MPARSDDDHGSGVAGDAPVLPLEAVRVHQRAQVGGKAAALGEMLGARLPVPPGYCITSAAFRRWVNAADAGPAIAALDTAPPDDADALAALGAALRSRLA